MMTSIGDSRFVKIDNDSILSNCANKAEIPLGKAFEAWDFFWKDFGRIIASDECPVIVIDNFGRFAPKYESLLRKIRAYAERGYWNGCDRLEKVYLRKLEELDKKLNGRHSNALVYYTAKYQKLIEELKQKHGQELLGE